jgi:hypothetical protein
MGFGSRLIKCSLAAELEAEVKKTYDAAGVVCDVSASLTDTIGTNEDAARLRG